MYEAKWTKFSRSLFVLKSEAFVTSY